MKQERNYLVNFNYIGMCVDILRNTGLIILVGITIWLGSTGVGKLLYTPQYTASATLVVQNKGNQDIYASLSTASSMAGAFSEVFQSDALRTLITEDVGEGVSGSIACSHIPETNLIMLQTTSADPRQAYLFIHSALKNYQSVSEYIFSNASLELVQEPSVPSVPSNASWFLTNRYKLCLLGMAGITGIIVLFYLLRYTVKDSGAAAELLDGEVIGVIPFEKKRIGRKKEKKKSLLLNSPVVSMKYAEECRKIEAKVEKYLRKNNLQVLLVGSISENEGKSTVAANLALAMAEKHKKVLLIDGDFRKPAQYKVFDMKDGNAPKSLSDFIYEKASLSEVIKYSSHHKIWELFQYYSEEKPAEILQTDRLENLLKTCREKMDYIIIDSSPMAVAADAEMWGRFVDSYLFVVRQDWSDLRVINDTVDLVWESGKDFAGFVLNGFRESI